MHVEELRQKKQQLEDSIKQLIADFVTETDCFISVEAKSYPVTEYREQTDTIILLRRDVIIRTSLKLD